MSSQQKTKKKGKKGKGKGGRRPRRQLYRRKRGRKTSQANEALLTLLKPSEQDVMKLLAAQVHIGRRKAHVNMKRYIWKRRQDGIHVINLEKTWAKLILAARILVTCREPSDICIMSTRTYGQRGAIKFAHYTGATALVGKWVPGTFTNPQNKAFFEPRIVIVDDPSTCFAVCYALFLCDFAVINSHQNYVIIIHKIGIKRDIVCWNTGDCIMWNR